MLHVSWLQNQAKRLIDLWASDKLVRGVGLLGLGELLVRMSRLFTAIVLARTLGPAELGIAATAISAFELVRILANNGLGQMVIRASADRLEATCNSAAHLMRLVCLGMAVLLLVAGTIIAAFAGKPELMAMTTCLSCIFLVMPAGMVNSWLLQREQRMGRIAGIGTMQVGVDNLLTALLALGGLGPWSIVLPKLLTAPLWLAAVRFARPWVPDANAGRIPLAGSWRFSGSILASEILVAVRFNVDKMLVGALVGLEALGIYYFAFNAGYGLSLVLTGALASASFPHLADPSLSRAELLARFDRALARIALPICGLITLQSLAIVVYVPLLFGARWEPFVPIVAVLCMSAVTKPCFDLAAQLLRAAGRPELELKGSFVFTLVLLGSFAAFLPLGLLPGVIVIAIVSISLQVAFAIWARHCVARGSRSETAVAGASA